MITKPQHDPPPPHLPSSCSPPFLSRLFAHVPHNVTLLLPSLHRFSTQYVANTSGAAAAFKFHLDSVKRYMRYREIPADMQANVLKYFDNRWAVLGGVDETRILAELPDALRTQVEVEAITKMLSRHDLLRGAPVHFTNALANNASLLMFSPREVWKMERPR